MLFVSGVACLTSASLTKVLLRLSLLLLLHSGTDKQLSGAVKGEAKE